MKRIKWDYDTFITLPTSVKTVSDEAVEHYLEAAAAAKAKMETLGFNCLLDKKVDRRPPRLRRRVG